MMNILKKLVNTEKTIEENSNSNIVASSIIFNSLKKTDRKNLEFKFDEFDFKKEIFEELKNKFHANLNFDTSDSDI